MCERYIIVVILVMTKFREFATHFRLYITRERSKREGGKMNSDRYATMSNTGGNLGSDYMHLRKHRDRDKEIKDKHAREIYTLRPSSEVSVRLSCAFYTLDIFFLQQVVDCLSKII